MDNNLTLIQYFHWFYANEKNLWNTLVEEAESLHQKGFSAIWLPPAYKAAQLDSVGYDPYDLYDLGEFDQKGTVQTKYGTKKEFLQAVQALHDQEMKVYADVVLNHKAGADETEKIWAHKVDPDNRKTVISEDYEIEAFTKFNFPGRQNQYSEYKWDFHSFSGVDWDDLKKETGIFKILNEYGTDWANLLYDEKGNFDYLMFSDVEFRNPYVVEELKRWGKWFLDTTGIDGFRLDALKHIHPEFYPEWLDHLRSQAQKELFTVGEYNTSLDDQMHYLDFIGHRMSLFDFSLQEKFRKASREEDFDLRTILDNTLTQKTPVYSVSFVENHDTQKYRNRDLEVKEGFKPHAYALILLRREGYPCVFYPDLYGFEILTGKGEGKKKISMNKVEHIDALLRARKEFAYGPQQDYFVSENLIGWTRSGVDRKAHSGLAALISTGEGGSIKMEVGEKHAGSVFQNLIHPEAETISIEDDGTAEFQVAGGSIAVWVPSDN